MGEEPLKTERRRWDQAGIAAWVAEMLVKAPGSDSQKRRVDSTRQTGGDRRRPSGRQGAIWGVNRATAIQHDAAGKTYLITITFELDGTGAWVGWWWWRFLRFIVLTTHARIDNLRVFLISKNSGGLFEHCIGGGGCKALKQVWNTLSAAWSPPLHEPHARTSAPQPPILKISIHTTPPIGNALS